jgi:hypothetical protein
MRSPRKAILALAALATTIGSCASTPEGIPFVERSYTLNTEYSIGQGEEIFAARTGEYMEDGVFVGLLYGGFVTDRWEENVEDHKLIFSGMDGARIDAAHQIMTSPLVPIEINSTRNPHNPGRVNQRNNQPGSNVFRDVHFEDFHANGISYAGVQIEVLEATGQRLRYRITSDSFGEGLTRAQLQEGGEPAPESDSD